jgi:hypothetical protein
MTESAAQNRPVSPTAHPAHAHTVIRCYSRKLSYANDITLICAFDAHPVMERVHIAELHPELTGRDSKQFKAAVTLIWPYSSSQREFALLLAEPEFRLRRKKGQVRARFSGSSAKALATTGVGIGDEVVLSVRGARFVQEGTINTPGRSIDWELEYTQTLIVQVFRDGNEIANLELLDIAPTPAPQSPVRRIFNAIPSPMQQWTSPAFLKRARLSDGPFFEAPYDPLADENADGHDKKRRRTSYRDWKAWTYSARTPSPEKGDAGVEEDSDHMDASPSRSAQLPRTPLSPTKQNILPVVSTPSHGVANVEEETTEKVQSAPRTDDFVRDEDYYDLYAGPDEIPPADAPYAFGGDTEANTEEEEELLEDTDVASISATEVDTELDDDRPQEHESGRVGALSSDDTEGDSHFEVLEAASATAVTVQHIEADLTEDIPVTAMPPPTLPTLNTTFPAPAFAGMLTPIGKEPASPTLEPIDSALLPLPSPFPGGRDSNTASYLDYISTSQQPFGNELADEQGPPSDANYILENSFFSSIGSSRSNALHPDHESAFTPVRFTFGMDGAGFSRPLDLSSPVPEDTESIKELMQQDAEFAASSKSNALYDTQTIQQESSMDYRFTRSLDATNSSILDSIAAAAIEPQLGNDVNVLGDPTRLLFPPQENQDEMDVIELSSGSESEDPADSEAEKDVVADEAMAVDVTVDGVLNVQDLEQETTHHTQEHQRSITRESDQATTTIQSAAVSAVFGFGSLSNSSEVEAQRLQRNSALENEAIEDIPLVTDASRTAPDHDLPSADNVPTDTKTTESHSELTAMDYASVIPDLVASTPKEADTHTPIQEETPTVPAVREISQVPVETDQEHRTGTIIPDVYMENKFLQENPLSVAQLEAQDLEDHSSDIKMESIEDGSLFQLRDLDTAQEQSEIGSGEILIAVPDDGHKVGELHTISVPATAPARNTRSKANVTVSPIKEDPSPPKRTTRSTRSKASLTPIVPTTLSPSRTRLRSTMSPSQGGTQTSPYSLRSQSKLLSPTNSTSVTTSATRRSPRKHASQRSVDSLPNDDTSYPHHLDQFLTSFEPSQELGASQGRYSNVPFVKDSEEESLHSEQSISTVKYSDDWNMFTNFSDPMMETERDQNAANLKPPPATAPELGHTTKEKPTWSKSEPRAMVSLQSSPVQSDFGSPGRKLRSADSAEVVPSSPRVLRTTRHFSQSILSSPFQSEAHSDEMTPKAQETMFPTLLGEGETTELKSSPPPTAGENVRRSPPYSADTFPSLNHQPAMAGSRPITPEATQQTNMKSQTSFVLDQQQQDLPLTPQLTQGTSAGLRSFNESVTINPNAVDTPTKPSPTIVAGSTPHRNDVQTDVASPSTTPKKTSPNVSSDAPTAVEKPEAPSVGLSTPLAYYTPLNALTYFLNRSSQFHTASNPDVLALVTSSTSTPQRSAKGRKDWNTILHITDLSTWPTSTTVNIFRPYQNALPAADIGDVVLLRAFTVKSLNRHPTLISADESSWCVWRYGKPAWGRKRSAFGEIRAREEVNGPEVERGEGEWREVEKIRTWYMEKVKPELEEKVHTRSRDKGMEESKESQESHRQTRSRDKVEVVDKKM